MIIMAIAVTVTSINVALFALAWRWLRSARAHWRDMARVHARAVRLHDEIKLVLIDNDRLRREGVWQDGDRWYGRMTVSVEAGSQVEAAVKLKFAVGAIAGRGWHTLRAH